MKNEIKAKETKPIKSKQNKIEVPENEDNLFSEAIDNAPPEIKHALQQFSLGILSTQQISSRSSKFFDNISDKITEDHIDKIIDKTDTTDKREFIFNIFIQIRNLLLVSGCIALFVWLTIYLASKNEPLYKEVLKITVSFLGGLGLGFGIKSYRKKSD
ncbi:hypothetical protein [Treponema denticola]|uniref:hypothetical protein n=1 Tax=Treponema denticola TaxID=158 RepID=UPI0020A432C5|nr:hypothetical protein [Treponema denticola]UTC82689.1 hypothetical protein HGJ18_05515 [Treponema denticola]